MLKRLVTRWNRDAALHRRQIEIKDLVCVFRDWCNPVQTDLGQCNYSSITDEGTFTIPKRVVRSSLIQINEDFLYNLITPKVSVPLRDLRWPMCRWITPIPEDTNLLFPKVVSLDAAYI